MYDIEYILTHVQLVDSFAMTDITHILFRKCIFFYFTTYSNYSITYCVNVQ